MVETERSSEVRETSTGPDGAQTRRETVTRVEQTSGVIIAQRIIWFIVGVVDVLIAIRFVLLLLSANRSAGFVDFIYGLTSVLVAPFVGIFGAPVYGHFMFEWSSVLAIIVYTLIGWGIVKLITLTRPHEEI